MQNDLKIGLISGLVLASVAVLWLATRPSLSPQGRMQDAHGIGIGPQAAEQTGLTGWPAGNVKAPERDNLDRPGTGETIRYTRSGERIEPDRTPRPAIYEQPEPTKPQRFHIVRDGETLTGISYDYYGSATKWRRIFEANRNTIKDPDVVMPGTKVIIPN